MLYGILFILLVKSYIAPHVFVAAEDDIKVNGSDYEHHSLNIHHHSRVIPINIVNNNIRKINNRVTIGIDSYDRVDDEDENSLCVNTVSVKPYIVYRNIICSVNTGNIIFPKYVDASKIINDFPCPVMNYEEIINASVVRELRKRYDRFSLVINVGSLIDCYGIEKYYKRVIKFCINNMTEINKPAPLDTYSIYKITSPHYGFNYNTYLINVNDNKRSLYCYSTVHNKFDHSLKDHKSYHITLYEICAIVVAPGKDTMFITTNMKYDKIRYIPAEDVIASATNICKEYDLCQISLSDQVYIIIKTGKGYDISQYNHNIKCNPTIFRSIEFGLVGVRNIIQVHEPTPNTTNVVYIYKTSYKLSHIIIVLILVVLLSIIIVRCLKK